MFIPVNYRYKSNLFSLRLRKTFFKPHYCQKQSPQQPKWYTHIWQNSYSYQSYDPFPSSPAACSCDSPWSLLARNAAEPARCRCLPRGTLVPSRLGTDWLLTAPPGPPPPEGGGWGADSAHEPGRSESPARSPEQTRSLHGPEQWPLTDREAACRRASSALWQAHLYPCMERGWKDIKAE